MANSDGNEKAAGGGLLTVEDAARLARTPVPSVRQWIGDGRLKSMRPGRRVLISRRALAACIGCDVADLGD